MNILQDFTFYSYSEVEIAFSIKTKTIDLKTLTEYLNLEPTRSWSNGEKYVGKQHNSNTNETELVERQRPFTLFEFATKQSVKSKRFHEHAEYLLVKLDSIKDNIKNLVSQPDKYEILIQVYLTFDKKQDNFGFSVDSFLLKRLTEYCQQIEWRNT